MTLGDLIDQQHQAESKLKETKAVAAQLEHEIILNTRKIKQQAYEDFAHYLSTECSGLPEAEKPTEWFVHYRTEGRGSPMIYIGITHLGGKRIPSTMFRDQLKEFLPAADFGKDYPINVEVKMIREPNDMETAHGSEDL